MTRVLLFARAPRRGRVKTRLAAEVGEDTALAAYREVGRRVIDQLGAACPVTVWYDPPDAVEEMQHWLGSREFTPQQGEDLGARMAHAFGEHFGRGDSPVIAVGADAPGVDAATIAAAEEALGEADVVLGPALDGGYYLLGLARPVPELLEHVPWGTSSVLQVTVTRCFECDLRVKLLEPLRDLDAAADLEALGLGRA